MNKLSRNRDVNWRLIEVDPEIRRRARRWVKMETASERVYGGCSEDDFKATIKLVNAVLKAFEPQKPSLPGKMRRSAETPLRRTI